MGKGAGVGGSEREGVITLETTVLLLHVPWLVLASILWKIPNFVNHFSSLGQPSTKPKILSNNDSMQI